MTGSLTVNGEITTQGFTNLNGYTVSQARSGNNAYFALHNSAGAAMGYLYWDTGNRIVLQNNTGSGYMIISPDGSITTSGGINVNGAVGATGTFSRNGISGSNAGGAAQYNHYWTGAQNTLWFGDSNWGQIQTNSDYRMKKDIEPLGSMWGTVKALNPISYTHKDWTPPASVESQKKIGGSLIRSDNIERWGFLAHELQETLVESAANGVKDDPVAVQSPNPFTVIAALTRALQEAMTRIEALEAAREG